MNSNWFKLVMKMTKVEYGKEPLAGGCANHLQQKWCQAKDWRERYNQE